MGLPSKRDRQDKANFLNLPLKRQKFDKHKSKDNQQTQIKTIFNFYHRLKKEIEVYIEYAKHCSNDLFKGFHEKRCKKIDSLKDELYSFQNSWKKYFKIEGENIFSIFLKTLIDLLKLKKISGILKIFLLEYRVKKLLSELAFKHLLKKQESLGFSDADEYEIEDYYYCSYESEESESEESESEEEDSKETFQRTLKPLKDLKSTSNRKNIFSVKNSVKKTKKNKGN